MNPINTHKDYTVDLLLSPKLEVELIEVIYLLRNQPDNPATKKKAINLLTNAVEDNLDHYFTKPAAELKISRLGITALKQLEIGVLSTQNSDQSTFLLMALTGRDKIVRAIKAVRSQLDYPEIRRLYEFNFSVLDTGFDS